MSWENILKTETPHQQARRILKRINELRVPPVFRSEGQIKEFLDEMHEYWEKKVIRTTNLDDAGGDESEDWDTPR